MAGVFVGSEFIKFYGIELCDLPCEEDEDDDEDKEPPDQPAYVAIGAWYMLEADVTPEQKAAIDLFRNQQPEAVVGNSIFVFRVSEKGQAASRSR